MSARKEKTDDKQTIRIGLHQVNVDAIPQEIKDRPQWTAWNHEDGQKIPRDARTGRRASCSDPNTWATFDEAMAAAKTNGWYGPQFNVSKGGFGKKIGEKAKTDERPLPTDPYVVIDIDRCYYPMRQQWEAAAYRLCEMLDTYVEFSPSMTGVKIWLKCIEPVDRAKREGTWNDGKGNSIGVECDDRAKPFTVTGNVVPAFAKPIANRPEQYKEFLRVAGMLRQEKPARPAVEMVATTDDVQSTEDKVRAALACVSSDSRSVWMKMGFALRWWADQPGVGVARSRSLWDDWSKGSPKFDAGVQDRTWDGMTADGGTSLGTLFQLAKDEGYATGEAVRTDGTKYRVERGSKVEATTEKPVVELPNIGGWTRTTITDAAATMGGLFSNDGGLYLKSGVVVSVSGGKTRDVDATGMQSAFERKATLVVARNAKEGVKVMPTTATQGQAAAILSAEPFLAGLPQLTIISKCPVLVEAGGILTVVRDYSADAGVLVVGGKADDVPLDEAVRTITDCLSDFAFQTPADRSRAIASLITPALVQGGMLGGRAPLDLSEADQSQSGKSYRAKLVAAFYNDTPHVVTQRKGGTGGIEESFSSALINGESFISLENVRGRVDSQMIESAITEDRCDARVPYRRPQQVDMRRVCVMLTSNKAELTRDMSNRASPVRIRKRAGHQFRTFGGLDLLGHVRQHQGRHLGAVFAVVKAWHAAGKPSTAEVRHDMRAWAGALDWIVTNLFKAAPLCDGIEEAKERMSSPHLNWLRDIALAVAKGGRCGHELMTWELVRLAHEDGIEVPGLDEGDLEDDATMNKVNQGVGRRLGSLFGERARLSVDGHEVERLAFQDEQGRPKKKYVFRHPVVPNSGFENETSPSRRPSEARIGETIGENTDTFEGEPSADENQTTKVQCPPSGSPSRPPMVSPMKSQCSPSSPMGTDLLPMQMKSALVAPCSSGSGVLAPHRGTRGKEPVLPPFLDDEISEDERVSLAPKTLDSAALVHAVEPYAEPFEDWGGAMAAVDWKGVDPTGTSSADSSAAPVVESGAEKTGA